MVKREVVAQGEGLVPTERKGLMAKKRVWLNKGRVGGKNKNLVSKRKEIVKKKCWCQKGRVSEKREG